MSPRALALFLATLAAASALAVEIAAPLPDPARGRSLYELRCGECHGESVHGRAHRVARDLEDIRQWVRRWSDQLHLGWGREEVDDVAAYLNATYYRFACDAPDCDVVSMTHPARR